MRGWYRRRPKVSFALASAFVFLLAGILTGVVNISFNPDALTPAALGAFVLALIVCLTIYEW